MAETVYTISDYPVYNPDGMTESGGTYSKGLTSGQMCELGFFVPLSDLPAGYRNALISVDGLWSPIRFYLNWEVGFYTDGGFIPHRDVFTNSLTYRKDGVDYLVPTVRCTNNLRGTDVTVSELLLRVTDGGQAPVRLGSEGIKGVRLGETPVVGLRLGDKKLF